MATDEAMRDTSSIPEQGRARHDKMVGLIEMMMTADSLRLTAYGQDENEARIVKDLPKAKTPREQESLQRQIAATDKSIDALVYELSGLTEYEIRIVEGEGSGTPGICGMSPKCEGG